MNLIERALTWDQTNQHPDEAQRLLNELAGEIERLWAFEKNFNEVVRPAFTDQCQVMADALNERNAEIARLKATVDTVALQGAWFEGYHRAAAHFGPIVSNLMGAIGFMEAEDDHEG